MIKNKVIRELEEKEKSQGTVKPRNSAQDALGLNNWEKRQEIMNSNQETEDPRHGSPWAKKTPLEELQDITYPAGKDVALAVTEYLLKHSNTLLGKAAGTALGKSSPILDVFTGPGEAW